MWKPVLPMIPRFRSTAIAIVLLSLMSLTLAGCSYFNAFYNTKRAFSEAETKRERSTDLNSRPSEYNDAVEAGSRLLEMYPESKYVDDTLYIMGRAYYWLQDYHKARRKFEELLSNYPDSPHALESNMWLGRVQVQLKKRQEATALLRGVIADTDDPYLIGESRFALAELYYVDSLFVKAAEEFTRIPDISDDDELIGKALWRAGESLFREKRYVEASEQLKRALKYDLTPSMRFQTRLLYGQSLRESGDPEGALEIYNSLLKDKRYFQEHGKVRVQKGLALTDLGQRETGFEEWEKTILDHQRSDEAAQAYYEMGMVHLSTMGERPEAKEKFDKARTEKARSKYSMKADSMLTMLNRVDDLHLSRVRTRHRIDFTEQWVANPISPDDTSAFQNAEFYDSLAIDSLKLIPLWKKAWWDSTVVLEDTTSVDTLSADSLALDSLAMDSLTTDSLALVDLAQDSLTQARLASDSLVADLLAADSAQAVMGREDELIDFSGQSLSAEQMNAAADDSLALEEAAMADDTLMVAGNEGPKPQLNPMGEYQQSRPDSVTRRRMEMDPGDVFGNPGTVMMEGEPSSPRLDSLRRAEMRRHNNPYAMPDESQRPPGMPEEEWQRALEQRRMMMEQQMGRGGPMQPGLPPSPGETGGAEGMTDLNAGKEQQSGLPGQPPAAPEPDVEIIKVFDIQPVLDSLAQFRVDLQDARFQLGEIQLFDLEQPDSARVIFRELTEPSNVDSVRARAMVVLAYIEKLQGDTTAADSILLQVAEEFPGTRQGNQLIEKLGMVKETPATPAELAYREAERLLLDDDSMQEAYTQYRWVSDTYSDTEWAPRAMYAAAYIAGHHLGDGETAEELLTSIIDDYSASIQAQKAREKISAFDAIRFASDADTVGMAEEFADIDAFGEDEVDEIAQIIGGMQALSSTLEGRNLLPAEVIQGTGGEVLLRYVVNTDQTASNFKIVMEDPPGSGLGRAMVAGLEAVEFRAARVEGEAVASKVERRYTLPLDAPPNVRPLPKR
ncbi:tetratricopeptide repeat protein [bacterium]|nr:tetratricopeptide repeat protein [bacterium]